jgi:hypothetical protein
MATQPFWDPLGIFSGNPMSDQSMLASSAGVPSPEQIKSNRDYADALRKFGTAGPMFKPIPGIPFSKWQGASNITNSIMGGLADRQASIAEQRNLLEKGLKNTAAETPLGGNASVSPFTRRAAAAATPSQGGVFPPVQYTQNPWQAALAASPDKTASADDKIEQ